MTKKEMFAHIASINADNAEVVEFCNHEIELLENRKSTKSDKPSKAQRENAALAEKVIAVMGLEPMTATDIVVAVNCSEIRSPQKVVGLMKGLLDEGRVVKVKDGKKVFFKLNLDGDEDEGEEE